jgi:hypothetical protein
LGAVGDGRAHPISDWIKSGKYKGLKELQKDYPFATTLNWSVDEAAFQKALHDLPPEGGTVHIPAGQYVASAYGWRINRDHVRLVGAGPRATTLATEEGLNEGLALAPYRHGGWLTGVGKEYPYSPDSGNAGENRLRLAEPHRASEFKQGELVFVRNGACRFDQDYGEFNEVAGTTPEGDLVLVHPLSRDYTLAALNWANETAAPCTIPPAGKSFEVQVRTGPGYAFPNARSPVSLEAGLFEVVRVEKDTLTLLNPGRANPPEGTLLPAGSRMATSRTIIKLTKTTRDFHASGLRVFGRRKALNLSNSYETSFEDCDFCRRPDAAVRGGLTIDGDGGRFTQLRGCTIRGTEPCGMQFARSFGNITLIDCTVVSSNVVFSEFNFSGRVQNCQLQTPAAVGSAIIIGHSCGDLTIEDNQISVTGTGLTVFDATTDIHSQKHNSPGRLVVRRNRILAGDKPRIFLLKGTRPSVIEDNTLNGNPVAPTP